MNVIANLVAALVPLILGFIWYNPKVFGNAWMKHGKLSEEELKGGNMIKIFGFMILFSVMLSFILSSLIIHQMHIDSLLMNEEGFEVVGSEVHNLRTTISEKYGATFRTPTHGIVHGLFLSIFFILPMIAINALFELKNFKYIFINAGFWTVSVTIMSIIISAWR
ncbi:MAG: DUF1761 domain-containing protein [Chitinophagales bacterium]|nr:DUF1761 domain-containing protein [Chitinophagales bacterium]